MFFMLEDIKYRIKVHGNTTCTRTYAHSHTLTCTIAPLRPSAGYTNIKEHCLPSEAERTTPLPLVERTQTTQTTTTNETDNTHRYTGLEA